MNIFKSNFLIWVIMSLFIMISGCVEQGTKLDNIQDSQIKTDEDNSEIKKIKITIGDKTLSATLEDNSSTEALIEMLLEEDLVINMSDFGNMEKVGNIGKSLPTNDEQISTEAGDIILYQGNALVIYYDTNSWNFTRMGKIDNISQDELKDILGEGDVKVTISLEK